MAIIEEYVEEEEVTSGIVIEEIEDLTETLQEATLEENVDDSNPIDDVVFDGEGAVEDEAEVDPMDLDDEDLLDRLDEFLVKDAGKALDAKERGNKFFMKGDYNEALECYAEALLFVPEENTVDRSLYHNNKAAAHFMLHQWDDVVFETTMSIHLDAKFTKAYLRRAKAQEKLEKFEEAVEDYKMVVSLNPDDKASAKKVEELGKIVSERFEKQKDEMLGKLKDFGNTILGKFGMSMDQFQAVQDPNTGSYSISFGNSPGAPKE